MSDTLLPPLFPNNEYQGPVEPISKEIWTMKYANPKEGGTLETHPEAMERIAKALSDDDSHKEALEGILKSMRFLPAGRIQAGAGSKRKVTLMNCYVAGEIEDSMDSIMKVASQAAETMRMGGGVGFNFGKLRPRGDLIKSLDSKASGPISFMAIFDAVCQTIASAGHRRGAMMGCFPVSHPDILEFIHAKRNSDKLKGFNISVLVDTPFMEAVEQDKPYNLTFEGKVYKTVRAKELWDEIMVSTWDWAEPGVLFIDRMNEDNNVWYAHDIIATNPSMPKGTLVHTNKGIKPIETLEDTSFLVRVLDGSWATANCFLSSPSAPVYEITLGNGKSVKATAQHKWPILQEDGSLKRTTTTDIKVGDRIPLNYNGLPGIHSSNNLDEYDGFILGMLYGDGWYGWRKSNSNPYIGFTFNLGQLELAEKVVTYWRERYGVKVNVTNAHSNEANVQIGNKKAIELFFSRMGIEQGKSSKVVFPEIVFESSDGFTKGFIDGLFSSDGYVDTKYPGVILTNKDFTFCQTVAKLLAFCGVKSSLISGSTVLNGKRFYRTDVRIGSTNIEKFANLFTLSCLDKQRNLDAIIVSRAKMAKKDSSKFTDYEVVNSVELVSDGEPVWDISVDHPQHVFPTEWVTTGNCGEVCLQPHGACLLGSLNLTQYIVDEDIKVRGNSSLATTGFDLGLLKLDIPHIVRMMDNVNDYTHFPLKEQQEEALKFRRIGLGVTGVANALESLGMAYGSEEFITYLKFILGVIRDEAYKASIELAKEKGSFPMFDADKFLQSGYAKKLPPEIREQIKKYGIRNSHLLSVAPTGCQVGSTLVPLNSGIVSLDELAYDKENKWLPIEDSNLNEHLEKRAVTKTFYNGLADTKKITLKSGCELEATNNHKFKVLEDSQLKWVKVEDLKVGDKLVVSLNTYGKEDDSDIQLKTIERGHLNENDIKQPEKITEDLAWFLGLYFADGSNHAKGIRISCNIKEVGYNIVSELGERLFGITPQHEFREDRGLVSVYFSSQQLLRWLKANDFLKPRSQDMNIPLSIRKFSRCNLESFIQGYFEGAGSHSKSCYYIDSVSKKFALQLQAVSRALGKDASINIHTSGKGSTIYRTRFTPFWRNNVTKDEKNCLKKVCGDNLRLDSVVSLEDSIAETFDIEVPEGNTYIANGIISHNTISLSANNISSGIEPVFCHSYNRTIQTFDGPTEQEVCDYGYKYLGVKGKTTGECTVDEHLAVLAATQEFIDQAVSKTCNVGDDVTFDEFKDVYMKAWKLGCKGVTTFRAAGKRYGILNVKKEEEEEEKKEENNTSEPLDNGAEACYYDPTTGKKTCD